MSRVST